MKCGIRLPKLKAASKRTMIALSCFAIALVLMIVLIISTAMARGTESVVRAKTYISAGTKIDASMLTVVQVGMQNLPQGTERSLDSVIGRYSAVDITPGDIITDSKFRTYSMYNLQKGQMLMSITIKDFADGLSAKLQSGDIVSVFVPQSDNGGTEQSDNTPAQTPPELQYVQVATVTAQSGHDTNEQSVQNESNNNGQSNLPATVTLVVNDKQASILAGYENSNIHLGLVCRGNKKKAAALLKAQDEYFNPPASSAPSSSSAVSGSQVPASSSSQPTTSSSEAQ